MVWPFRLGELGLSRTVSKGISIRVDVGVVALSSVGR